MKSLNLLNLFINQGPTFAGNIPNFKDSCLGQHTSFWENFQKETHKKHADLPALIVFHISSNSCCCCFNQKWSRLQLFILRLVHTTYNGICTIPGRGLSVFIDHCFNNYMCISPTTERIIKKNHEHKSINIL